MIQVINIRFDRKAFEAMYFRNFEDSYVLGPKTKLRFIAALTITILVPVITATAHASMPSIMLASWVLFILIWVDYLMMIYKIRKWKKSIHRKLDEQSKVKSMRLGLSNDGITIYQDELTITEEWINFTETQLTASFILLKGETDYFFPSTSMHPTDYELMIQLVSDKISIDEIDLLEEELID